LTPGYTPQPGTAIPTNAPPNTPEPTAVPPEPVRPNGPLLHAAHVANPPTIDAQGGEWPSPLPYPIDQIVFQVGNWSGPADQSGTFAFAWDANNLYLFVNVVDDIHVQTAHGELLYKGDSLELQFDADLPGDFNIASLNGDDHQLGLSPGENRGTPEVFLWNPSGRYGVPSGLSLASRPTEPNGGYTFEAALPWSFFGITPVPGKHFGLALNSSDDDVPGTAAQQSMLSSVSTRLLLDPTSWGTIQIDP
jgi:cellulose/xylan binding protein with CBM9 domain